MGKIKENSGSAGARPLLWLAGAIVTMLLTGAPLRASSAMLECTGDTWVDAKQADQNHGSDKELALHGKDRLGLLSFRFSAVPDWRITRATLLLHQEDLKPLRSLRVAPAPAPWVEMEVTYDSASLGHPWPGGHGLWELVGKELEGKRAERPVKELESGWIEIEIPPALVQDCVSRKAFGIVLFDPRRDGERAFQTRESLQYAPYLKVEGVIGRE